MQKKISSKRKYDAIIIGGGFYGTMLALFLKKHVAKVLIIEKNDELLAGASYNNQARVHNGYHYPRSFTTAYRSHVNFSKFVSDFSTAIDDSFTMLYAVAKRNSKVTARQFVKFCNQVGSKIENAPLKLRSFFNPELIDDVFVVEEVAYNAAILRRIIEEKLDDLKVKVQKKSEAIAIKRNGDSIDVVLNTDEIIEGGIVFNCTYAHINELLKKSHLTEIALKHEITEMPLITMPEQLKKIGITIIDGPFFSIMPFPDRKLHSFHHVRYTPILSSLDISDLSDEKFSSLSRFNFMIKDAQRYIPLLKKVTYVDSIRQIKSVLLQNEVNDRRPILFSKNHGIPNFHVILGGKIDNIYDLKSSVDKLFI